MIARDRARRPRQGSTRNTPTGLHPLFRVAAAGEREEIAEAAGVTDESVCPTKQQSRAGRSGGAPTNSYISCASRLRSCGAGAFACKPILSESRQGAGPAGPLRSAPHKKWPAFPGAAPGPGGILLPGGFSRTRKNTGDKIASAAGHHPERTGSVYSVAEKFSPRAPCEPGGREPCPRNRFARNAE